MFYLATHSTHFILRLYGIRRLLLEGKGNVLLNDILNTFYFTIIWHQKAAFRSMNMYFFTLLYCLVLLNSILFLTLFVSI